MYNNNSYATMAAFRMPAAREMASSKFCGIAEKYRNLVTLDFDREVVANWPRRCIIVKGDISETLHFFSPFFFLKIFSPSMCFLRIFLRG